MLDKGEQAPDFALPDQSGRTVRLEDLLASGPAVLFFYPSDFSPGCTKQACSVRDIHAELAAAGLAVAGISPQSVHSHARFKDEHNLPYPLLADEDRAVARAYKALGPLRMIRRTTYLIGPDARVIDALRAELRIGRHDAFLRAALDARRAGHGDRP